MTTGRGDIASTVSAMRAGAEAFLEKRAPKEALLDSGARLTATDANALGGPGSASCERGSKRSPNGNAKSAPTWSGAGSTSQIASDLGIHERTVKLHRTAITNKLVVPSVAALTRLTQEAGLFTASEPTYPKVQWQADAVVPILLITSR